MKINQISRHLIFGFILLAGFILTTSFIDGNGGTSGSSRDNTTGIVTFTATTSSPGGTYSPKHVLAIWVEKNGVFVKTRKAMANARKQYLYMWKAASNYNVIDAITGPTLLSHQTHTVTWNCTDLAGNIVPDGDYTIFLEFTDKHAQGPFVSVTFTKGTQPVTLNPANQTYIKNIQLTYVPTIANFTANVNQICSGQNVVFTDNSTGATSWSWNFGAGASPATATTQGPHTVNYSTPGNKTVSLTINGSVTETKTDYITVSANPIAGFTFEQDDLTVTFTNTSQHAASYLWDFGDGNTSAETNPVHTYISGGNYLVSLTATSISCGNDIHTESITLVTATANFNADITDACPAENITFTDNSTAATSWEWDFGTGAVPATANTQGPHTVYYNSPGAKTISLTINGTVNTTKTDYISIHPDPVAGFTWEQSSLTISFNNTSQNAASYSWDFGDGNTSNEVSPVHTYDNDGTYLVSLTSTSEYCGDDIYSETLILSTIGVDENNPSRVVRIFPNPSDGNFVVTLPQGSEGDVHITIYNSQGKQVGIQHFSGNNNNNNNNNNNILITLSNQVPGIYFLNISTATILERKKILIK